MRTNSDPVLLPSVVANDISTAVPPLRANDDERTAIDTRPDAGSVAAGTRR